jgi:hypothetical protein
MVGHDRWRLDTATLDGCPMKRTIGHPPIHPGLAAIGTATPVLDTHQRPGTPDGNWTPTDLLSSPLNPLVAVQE